MTTSHSPERTPGRINLPLLSAGHGGQGGRQHVTCRYKCGDACWAPVPNTSDNEYFGDIAKRIVDRRGVLRSATVAAVVGGGSMLAAACTTADSVSGTPSTEASGAEVPTTTPAVDAPQLPGLNFEPVAHNSDDAFTTAEGYEHAVVIAWGDPVMPGAPAFDFANQTVAAQEQQFGYNNDFAGLIDLPNGNFLLVTNHEYTTPSSMFAGYDDTTATADQVRIELAAHGLSVVEVQPKAGSGALTPIAGPYNRRIHGSTPFRITGPAAGSPFLRSVADPEGRTILGTLNNCSGSVTPWGTVLSGEENFNQYFQGASTVTDAVAAKRLKRYGIADAEGVRTWGVHEPRFNIAVDPNEVNRFGYVVEVNPMDPASVPIKHSALGRFKHEAAAVHRTDDGTIVAYTGDDERFDYMYKFISARKMMDGSTPEAMAHNMTLLDEGTLYVARFTGNSPEEEIDGNGHLPSDGKFDGTGEWIPLLRTEADGHGESLVPGMSGEEVAVFTREAGDAVGATKMDRPEDVQPNPVTGKIYAALTNNSNRGTPGKAGPDEVNPRDENKSGQVLELTDDHAGTTFTWELLLVCGAPSNANTYFGGFDKDSVSAITSPDNVAFDPHGNLWISTDSSRALKFNDGLFSVALTGPRRGETKQFLTVPIGGETCGPIVTADRILVSVQHPGETDEATIEAPASHWPDGGSSQPRSAVVVVWKADGSKIGS